MGRLGTAVGALATQFTGAESGAKGFAAVITPIIGFVEKGILGWATVVAIVRDDVKKLEEDMTRLSSIEFEKSMDWKDKPDLTGEQLKLLPSLLRLREQGVVLSQQELDLISKYDEQIRKSDMDSKTLSQHRIALLGKETKETKAVEEAGMSVAAAWQKVLGIYGEVDKNLSTAQWQFKLKYGAESAEEFALEVERADKAIEALGKTAPEDLEEVVQDFDKLHKKTSIWANFLEKAAKESAKLVINIGRSVVAGASNAMKDAAKNIQMLKSALQGIADVMIDSILTAVDDLIDKTFKAKEFWKELLQTMASFALRFALQTAASAAIRRQSRCETGRFRLR